MHPVSNIRGSLSRHLEGRTVVLAVAGSIAAVKAVELARELARHGADVVPVMSEAATRILHPDALEFATGHKPILRLTGAVEHISLLGNVKGKADLLLVAPATANTISKMALGIDDTPITTCATVAFGTRTPVVVAPAMHEAMLDHPLVDDHRRALVGRLGVTWVEPLREEGKAKLADVEAIVEAVIHCLAAGPLVGKKALVVAGATEEPIDPVRILTNRSSGRSGLLIATELKRLGADVTLWMGRGPAEVPEHLLAGTLRYRTHADLARLAKGDLSGFAQVWMPAAIGDFAAAPAKQKLSGDKAVRLDLEPLPKIIAALRKAAPKATLVAFKAESDPKLLLPRARDRLKRHKAQFVVANLAGSFAAEETEAHLVSPGKALVFRGPKATVLPQVVAAVLAASARKAAA
ncbi:MAG TPA: bifunctional phosphopantothenoylcysteine decarboxylase/phosphopantothenate--cysteine ligase CoaBC [Candidatus Thermoplasmatota archaeon]|nr:bifunctional phosphopantothenoylcysteine decarboxylase/phosphopantothenate--cysteine ligase CoaBC [Candidatus Thermoplasmatota archaeon]